MTAPVDEIRYLKRKNLENEALLQKNYLHEIIHHYGVDVEYYRLGLDYFATPSGTAANYTYGESTTSTYETSAPLVILMKVDTDSPLLRKFGIETTTNSEMFVMRQEFEEQFRDKVGIPTSGVFSTQVHADIEGFSGNILGWINDGSLSGMTSANTVVPSGTISGTYTGSFTRSPVAINPLIAKPTYYTARSVAGTLTGTVTGTIDASGNGTMDGTVSGILSYYATSGAVNGNPNWGIAPQVGDFFRLVEFDMAVGNYEEYEITEVLDKDLTNQGLNVHLHRYLWRCAVVRRDPSHETVSSDAQQELFTPNYLEENTWSEIRSNEIFDYANSIDSIDGENSDLVYGGM